MCVYLDVVAARKLLQESRFWGREFSSRQNVLIGQAVSIVTRKRQKIAIFRFRKRIISSIVCENPNNSKKKFLENVLPIKKLQVFHQAKIKIKTFSDTSTTSLSNQNILRPQTCLIKYRYSTDINMKTNKRIIILLHCSQIDGRSHQFTNRMYGLMKH